jgi:UDPglucose--hexose-1-phosphate uridylyltransferase
MTPPQTLVIPEEGAWRVRVVPNLYPALERQEVVVQSPDHVRSLAELGDDQLELVAEAWQRRRADLRHGYLMALVNEGRQAGASLPHTHSQLAWLPETPPPEPERDGEAIAERDGLAAWCPRVSRLPFEAAIAPTASEPDGFVSDLLGPALRLLADLVRRLHRIAGAVPLNAWLHNHDAGWRIVLLPRLSTIAALELGAGLWINTVAPEDAALALRNA